MLLLLFRFLFLLETGVMGVVGVGGRSLKRDIEKLNELLLMSLNLHGV